MSEVSTSVFELYKIGPGPSSSHTIGPMLAALDFRKMLAGIPSEQIAAAESLEVELYGSLSATGAGHGTNRAVIAGLLGWEPASVDPAAMDLLLSGDQTHPTVIQGKTFSLSARTVQFGPVIHGFAYSNTMEFRLMDAKGLIFSRRAFSVGGGKVIWDGLAEPEQDRPVHSYGTMNELLGIVRAKNISIPDLVLENETAITGAGPEEIFKRLDRILAVMDKAVDRGLNTRGILPGSIGLSRKAAGILERSAGMGGQAEKALVDLDAWAMAVGEENAAGHIVVTAPTLGSCGVIPAVIRFLTVYGRQTAGPIRRGLLTAAAVGFLIKHNASIAGADVGCQGEIGAASAMAAAMMAETRGYGPEIAASAAEIAMEHHLGLTCDPVGGYVQIPCIERNAMGAVKAYNSFLLASAGDPCRQKVSFDKVVEVMLATGRDMSNKYKETSQGGLAASLPAC